MRSLDTSLLFYLSGTGNTFRVACWIREHFTSKAIAARLKPIEEADVKRDFEDAHQRLTVVLFPTHGFMPPWSMIKFLFQMPRRPRAQVLTVATRGAYHFGRVTIPGAAGFSNFFAAMVLWCKGYDIRGFFSLDMPANLNNLHPSVSSGQVRQISAKAKIRLESFLPTILSGKRVLLTLNNLYEAIWTVLLFWWIPIFPLLYLIYAKTGMAKMMFANNRCVSCGLCSMICPNQAIEMKRWLGKKRPFWTYHCENCMRCMGFCKRQAVQAGHSLAIMQYFLVSLPVMAHIIHRLTVATGISFEIKNYWIMTLLDSLYYLPALFLSYWIFWLLIRIPAVNSFFSKTTLTHYFNRYREPETRIKDLMHRKPKPPGANSIKAESPTAD